MYKINNKYYKYLQKLYENNNYKYCDNIFKVLITKEKITKKLLKYTKIKGKIIKIEKKEKIVIELNNKKRIIITDVINNKEYNAIKIYISEQKENIPNTICITYQELYEKILLKINDKAVKKYIKQLQLPKTDEHYGLIITKKEKKYITKIINNKTFIKSINNNEFYEKNKKVINIILNKYLFLKKDNKEINRFLYKKGYTYNNKKYKKISDIILKIFEILKENGYEYKELYKIINIYGKDIKLIANENEIDKMKFPNYYDKKKYIEFENEKYYIYTGWYKCDYVDLKFRINNLHDKNVDYSIIKM